MRRTPELLVLARPTTRSGAWLKTCLAAAAIASVWALSTARVEAAAGGCSAGVGCTRSTLTAEAQATRYTNALQRQSANIDAIRRIELSDQDYSAFSGVGVMACTSGGATRSATAFLVGAFDIVVTVAHTFARIPGAPEPECLYNSMDSLGQVRERIPVAYVKTEWLDEAGQGMQKDLAVVRLSKPSRYAQRTMPLGRFSGATTPAVLVGYKIDVDVDTLKRKVRGTVSGRRVDQGFAHDIESRDLAAGSPVIDERTGVIIGVHSPSGPRRNTMIAMSEWLEQTLRDEMKLAEQAGAKATN